MVPDLVRELMGGNRSKIKCHHRWLVTDVGSKEGHPGLKSGMGFNREI